MNFSSFFHKRELVALFLAWAAFAFNAIAHEDVGDSNDAFAHALERALENPQVPTVLEISCTDANGARGFSLYASGTLIWAQRRQAQSDQALRMALLRDLKRAGFSRFDELYGGNNMPAESEAPLQVFCRIVAEIDSQRKSSAHARGGVEFAPLLQLAGALLDRAEPVGSLGITAISFSDALHKLAAGSLAPETLNLRLSRLPPRARNEAGAILRIEAGRIARTSYQPGKAAQQPEWRQATASEISGTAAALSEARFGELPLNLPGAGMAEIEVVLLNQRHTVIARPFTRIAPGELADEGRRFNQLIDTLLGLMDSGSSSRVDSLQRW